MAKKILSPEEMATQGTEELVDATPITQEVVAQTTPVTPIVETKAPVFPLKKEEVVKQNVIETPQIVSNGQNAHEPIKQNVAQTGEVPIKLADVSTSKASNYEQKPTDYNLGEDIETTPKANEELGALAIWNNNQTGFRQKDLRSPEQRLQIAKFLNKAFGAKIPETGDWNTEKEITKVYNANQENINQKLYEFGYIQPKKKTETEQKAADVLKEANDTGKSFLQLYQENIIKPQYETKKAQAIAKSKNMALLSDIIRLIGEAATTSKGGVPIVRPTIIPALNAQLDKLNEQYKAEVRDYNQKGFQYLLMDEKAKREQEAAKIKNALEVMKINQRGEKDKAQMELEAKKLGLSVDKYKEMVRSNKAREAISRQNANKSTASGGGSTVQVLWNGNLVNVPKGYYNLVAAKARASKSGTEKYTTSDLFNLYAPEYLTQDAQGNWMIKGENIPSEKEDVTTTNRATIPTIQNTNVPEYAPVKKQASGSWL